MDSGDETKNQCSNVDCENKGTLRCTLCRKVRYCSPKCQQQSWLLHIFQCNWNQPIRNTAHHLAYACSLDIIPSHAQTLEDYGFNRAKSEDETTMLFGLYQGFFILHSYKIEARTVNQWRKEGSLAQHIKEAFEQVAPDRRGLYYPWFLEHQWFLTPPGEAERRMRAVMEGLEEKLFAYLGPARLAQWPRWSPERKDCVEFLRLVLNDYDIAPYHPPHEWIGFGYCVARDDRTEVALTQLYQSLVQRCSFEEFCDAYEASTLVALMERTGAIPDRRVLPRHFEHVMCHRMAHESVWDLKQHLLSGGSISLPPSAEADYGFANCGLGSERKLLTGIYLAAWKKGDFDEMELRAYCLQDRILEYLERFEDLTKEKVTLERLMKNSHST